MSWHTDLSYGEQREQEFIKVCSVFRLTKLPGTGADFITDDGLKVELKSERRTVEQTKNIAVEVQSSFKKQGAIFNAVKNECAYICYFFACNTTFIYNASDLLRIARCYRRKYGTVSVRNSNAKVVLLPRELLRKSGLELWKIS